MCGWKYDTRSSEKSYQTAFVQMFLQPCSSAGLVFKMSSLTSYAPSPSLAFDVGLNCSDWQLSS